MSEPKQKCQVCITADLDPDNSTGIDIQRDNLSWQGVLGLKEVLQELKLIDKPISLFVRSDYQVAKSCGEASYWFNELSSIFDEVKSSGGVLGWHPHFASHDPQSVLNEAKDILFELKKRSLNIVRVGEAFHCNELMKFLSENNFRIDSTALPGRTRKDGDFNFDWQHTPNHPYYPSANDCRQQGVGDQLKILEVPMTTAWVEAPYDSQRVHRYLNLTYHSHIFKKAFADLVNAGDFGDCIVLIFHPHELIPGKSNDLYSFSIEECKTNLLFVEDELKRSNIDYSFVNISEIIVK